MLSMMMQLECKQELSQLPLTTNNSFHTIFPMVEAWLSYDDRFKAVGYMARRKDAGKYRSVIDFIFGESFGERERATCFNYYEDKGPKLKKLYTEEERRWYEHIMLGVCVAAYKGFCEKRRASWTKTVSEGHKMVLSPKPKEVVVERYTMAGQRIQE